MATKQKKNVKKAAKKAPKVDSFIAGFEGRIAKTAPQLVKITWMDACGHLGMTLDVTPGWEKRHKQGALMQITGYLLSKSKDWVTIAQERHADYDNGYRGVVDIPTYSICDLKVLEG